MNNSPIVYMTSAKASTEKEQEVLQALRDVAEAARQQPECLDYRIFRAQDGITINFERWSSEEARDAFNAGPAVEKFISAVSGNFAVSPQPISYEEIG